MGVNLKEKQGFCIPDERDSGTAPVGSTLVPSDLTPEECQELENIRRRKQELLADIQRLKDEIAEVTNEIENLGSTEER
nr:PREDICTED: cytohesin-1-like [Struthio camelus australis]